MQKGDELTLQVESLSGDGKSVAHSDGMVVFVDGDAVPGDTVRAHLWRIKKTYAEARAFTITSPSEARTKPQCRHFGVCGGCRWQNLTYDAQLLFKRLHVENTFRRIGGFEQPNVQAVLGCDEPYFYRNKMEYTFSNLRWLTDKELQQDEEHKRELALGLHVPERYDKILNLEECWLQSELSAEILKCVRNFSRGQNLSAYSTKTHQGYLRHLVIRDGKRTCEVMINLVTTYDRPDVMEKLSSSLLDQFPQITTIVNNITERKSMVAFGDVEKVYHGSGYITERLGGYTFRVSANSFFQTNTLQAEKLYDVVRQFAGLKSDDVVYDLYSGTGTIAVYLSNLAERVIGIESVPSAIADAERNAEVNRVTNCDFLQGDLKDRLTKNNEWLQEYPRPSVVVTDPPRSGMHPKAMEQIARLSPRRIVYVSCNPATQARDANVLVNAGYGLRIVQPVDMFPHADHIESVALFER